MLMDDLQQAFSVLMPNDLTVIHQQRVTGGCISDSCQVLTQDGEGRQQHWFAKSNQLSFLDNFKAEADELIHAKGLKKDEAIFNVLRE